MPETVDVFGWCTWDAFYTDVTPDGIELGVKALQEGGTPARFVHHRRRLAERVAGIGIIER